MGEVGSVFGLESIRVPQVSVEDMAGSPGEGSNQGGGSSKRASRPGWVDGEFLRGPIPLSWLGRLCRLKGAKVVGVGLALWFISGLNGNRRTGLALTSDKLARFGVTNRAAKSRALEDLERAGLVRVARQAGKNPVVDIVE